MAKKKVADLLVDVLAEAGVRQIYGVSGDSLNGITDSIRAGKQIQWIHVRHEETGSVCRWSGSASHGTFGGLRRQLRPNILQVSDRLSLRVRMAQDDVNKGLAALSETKDVFIPSITASGGAGASSGITLNVPKLFTVSTQKIYVFPPSHAELLSIRGTYNKQPSKAGMDASSVAESR